MNIKERIRNTLDRATQDFDGRDEMMKDALARIILLEAHLIKVKFYFTANGWEDNSLMVEHIDKVLNNGN